MAIIGAFPNTIANGQSRDATPLMADLNWILSQVNANAAALSLTPQLASANTFTAKNVGVAATADAGYPILSQTTGNFNWSFNTDFRIWGAGTAAAPTGWTLAGASASVAKNTTAAQFRWGTAGAALTRAGADATLSQDVSTISGFGPASAWGAKTITFGCWVYATVASRARIFLNDGTTTTYSSYHSGGSSLEFLTVTATMQSTPTAVKIGCSVDTGNTTGVFSGASLQQSSTIAEFSPPGFRGRKALIVAGSGNATSTAGSTGVISFGSISTQENDGRWTPPFAKQVARNLTAYSGAVPGGADTYTYKLRLGGADSALTCQTTAALQQSSDTTHEVYFDNTGLVDFEVIPSATAANCTHRCALEVEEVPIA